MAKLKIRVIELVAAVGQKDAVLDSLQRKGVLEVSVPSETEGLTYGEYTADAAEAERNIQLLSSARETLAKYASEKKPLTAMLEPRTELSAQEYLTRGNEVGGTLEECGAVLEKDRRISELKAENIRLHTLADTLEPWRNADVPLKAGQTSKTSYFFGGIKGRMSRDDVLKLLSDAMPENDRTEVEVVSADEVQTNIAVFCMTEDAEEVENILRSAGFARAPECAGSAAEAIADCERQSSKNGDEIASVAEELSRKTSLFADIDFAEDWYAVKKDKFAACGKIPQSARVFYLRGYIAQRDEKRVKSFIEKNFDAAVEISDPAEDEDVPVILSNNAFASPLENITGMYSMPSKGDIDPTGVMAFFYYFFFGMMLSDAGYGLIIVLATAALLLFKRNMETPLKNTVKMYLFCGLSTVFWGAMYGSWFGDAASVISVNFLGKPSGYTPAFFKPVWTDAVSDLMNVLIVCFVFGLVHLFTGVALKGITDIKNGSKFDAFCDTVPTFLTIVGIAPVFFGLFLQDSVPDGYSALGTFVFNAVHTVHAGLSKVNMPILIAGLILVVLTSGRDAKSIGGKIGGGLYGVYNLVGGYLGDVLSYARLLALGLATGVIAGVMNMLGTLPQNSTVKLILFIVVFVFGHIANLSINVIGAYVHTNRLQYVEFFGKFYEGGGRAFVPLAANTKTYKIREEN